MAFVAELVGKFGKSTEGRPRFALPMLALVLLLALSPVVLYSVFVMKILCYAILACSFNLLFGYAGLMSFGHAAFFGAGSYLAGWAIKSLGAAPEVALLLAMIGGVCLGLVFGIMSIQTTGMAFGMVTLALAQMLYFLFTQAAFTGGENGLINSERGRLFGLVSMQSDIGSYAFAAVVFLACFALILRVVNSPFGQILKAIRENETRVQSLGYDVRKYKLIVFILSATLAAVAGGLKAIVFGLATLEDAHFLLSGQVVLMTLLGGVGTLFGPVVGAIIVTAMDQYLAGFGTWVTFAQGATLVACVLLFRRGIVGEISAWLKHSA